MDFIDKKAKQLISYHLDQGVSQYKKVNSAIDEDLSELDEDDEKIKYLNIILEKTNFDYAEHLQKCDDPENCFKNKAYDHIVYFIQKELKHLGVRFNEDTFTRQEKEIIESKLDKIIADLNEVKLSQRGVYEEVMKEFEELKGLYYLGKKKWYQLLTGKSAEIVASGIVSETFCKEIIDQFRHTPLLGH